MLKTLIQKIKQHKLLFLVLIIIIIVVMVFLLTITTKQPGSLPGIGQEPTPTPAPALNLIETIPTGGVKRQSVDTAEYIQFRFSAPIDINSIRLTVKPLINVKATVFQDPTILWIVPKATVWKERTWYTITISELEGLRGERLQSPIEYTYYNNPPHNIDFGGENVFLDETGNLYNQ